MKRYRICVSVLAAMLTVSTAVFVTGCNTPVSPDNPGNTPGGDTGGTENPGDNTGGDSSELPVGNGTATITEDDFPVGEFDQYEITWTPAGGEKQPKLVDSIEEVIITGLNPEEKYTFTVTGVEQFGSPKILSKFVGEDTRASAVQILKSTDFNDFDHGTTHVDITWTPVNKVEQPLRVSLGDAKAEGVTAENFASGEYTFTLQGIRIEEKPATPEIEASSYSALLETGYNALEREDYDSAVASFMAAYAAEANNKTKMHAALARLAAISVNEQVVTLMRERIGFASYPGTLNALINTDEWCKRFVQYGHPVYFPILPDAPDWISSIGIDPIALWMAVLLNNNLEGVNDLIDSVLNNVFGKSYNEAVQLINSMDDESVDINNRFIRLLRLEDQLGGDTVRVTKAELKAITAALDIVKGTLQFLQAYNLNTPLNFLALDWIKGGEDIDFNGGKYAESYDPFNNGFLTQRSGYTTETAVNTYISALDTLIEAYESITADNKNYPSAAKDFLKKYSGYKELATNIKAAIEDGKCCEFPSINNEGIPQQNDTLFSINFGCMKDGFFSMEKLFVIENGKPVFYTVDRKTVVTAENIDNIKGAFGIALKNSFWTSIWDNGMQDNNPEFSVLGFCYKDTSDTDKDFGMDIFNFYYGN